ncbi:MAG: hypothetical protein KKD44_14420 [Proteobacteria bacterium]|nr:hypothetical protein [Pseudomonadota bacterium]
MKIDISTGELVDKVTILSIKLEKVSNPSKIVNIRKEYEMLLKPMMDCGIGTESDEFIKLRSINLRLWEIEDKIRIKETDKAFDNEFIDLARSIYFTNDDRAEIKKEINLTYKSELVEEKEYVDYKNKA